MHQCFILTNKIPLCWVHFSNGLELAVFTLKQTRIFLCFLFSEVSRHKVHRASAWLHWAALPLVELCMPAGPAAAGWAGLCWGPMGVGAPRQERSACCIPVCGDEETPLSRYHSLGSGRGSWDKSSQRHEPHWAEEGALAFRLPAARGLWEMPSVALPMHKAGLAGPGMMPGSIPWQSRRAPAVSIFFLSQTWAWEWQIPSGRHKPRFLLWYNYSLYHGVTPFWGPFPLPVKYFCQHAKENLQTSLCKPQSSQVNH